MHKSFLILAITTTLLAACNRPATPATPGPAASITPAPEAAVPAPAAPAAADATTSTPVPAADGEMQVDKSIDDVLGDSAAYRKVIADFQKAVAANDAAAAATLVHYPIGVDIAGKNTVIKDAAGFVQNFDKFMTPEIVKAIVDTQYGNVMVNDQGVMLGRGEAWVNGVCKDTGCKDVDVKVVTIQPGSRFSP